MQIIPVLDLSHGVAVHARAGDRSRYQPVHSVLAPGADGDPVALLRAFRATLGVAECYVADLDAIGGGAMQRSVLHGLAALETPFSGPLLVDAGTPHADGGSEVLASGAAAVVVGLESLHAFADLRKTVERAGPSRVIFSLDLRLGTPILHPAMAGGGTARPDAASLAERAVDAGVRSLLVLDVGRVGTGSGLDLGLLRALRRRLAPVRLLAGGGVHQRRDLDWIRDAGCDGVLVASAIHSGRIGAADVRALQSETSASR
ncbi:MAG: hisA/hisF family protein [Chthoniobacterales bacterium]|nr:hisA/hisF family protein [Chthoniobacterales bacterium]